MYSHHYLSAIILLIVVIIINIFSFAKEDNSNYFPKFLIMVLPEIYFSFSYVCGAEYIYMSKGNIYKLLFIDGIIGIILSILFQVITHFSIYCDSIKEFFIDGEKYCDESNRLNTMIDILSFNIFDIGISILLNFIHFFEIWLIWLLIFNFSVNHFSAIQSIASFFLLLIDIKHPYIGNYVVFILGSVIIIFTALVYNEIIILRFCGFDKNTVVEINRRSVIESNCDFGEDKDEISVKSNDNYLIMKDDIGSEKSNGKL